MVERVYGGDYSSFQSQDITRYGGQFAIVKSTQGTYYHNPKHQEQISSAKRAGMLTMEYHFATFSNNVSAAVAEAKYALSRSLLSKGSYIWLDWETGDGNIVTGTRNSNTQAILAFMDTIVNAGYKAGLYSGAALLRNGIDTKTVLAKYPNSLWVASYPISGVCYEPDFNYFPSMDGVAIWQFTDNWKGLYVDGNVMLINLQNSKVESEDDDMSFHPEVKYNELGVFKVNNPKGADVYKDENLSAKVDHKDAGSNWKINAVANGAVQAGTNQWFSMADGLTKVNPLSINDKAPAICRVTTDDAYTQAETKAGAGIEHLPKNTKWQVFGRVGKYLIVNGANNGKYLDGDKAVIVL